MSRHVTVTLPLLVVTLATVGGCTISDTPFGARCGSDVDCGAGLVCSTDVCVPGLADGGPDPVVDAGPDPLVDAGPDPLVDAGPEPIVDAGPEPVVFNRAPRAFATTVIVASAGTATVTLQGSDPDGDPLTFSVTGDTTTGSVTATGATATVTALDVDGAFSFTVSDGEFSDTATVLVKIAIPAADPLTTVFIGDNGESWNDAANWTIGVPGQVVFGARVPAGKVVNVQGATFNLSTLEVENGAVIELGAFSFNATEVRVGGEIRCTVSPCVRASRAAGRLPSWLAVDGARLVGPTIVDGRLITGGDFVIDANPLTALGPVDADGGLVQTGSLLHIEGNVVMQRNLNLAAGTWSLRGNLIRLAGGIVSTGTHRLLLDAAVDDPQTITLPEGTCVNDLEVQSPEVILGGPAIVCGRLTVKGGAHVGGPFAVDVAGPFVLEDGGRFDVAELRPRGGLTLPATGFDVALVRISAGLTVPVLPYRDLVVTGNGTVLLDQDVAVSGALRSVLNDFAEVDVGEQTLTLGELAFLAPARLKMIFPDAHVVIAGNATLAPNNGTTMTAGVVDVGGNLRFEASSNTRFGDGQHTWRITGPGTLTGLLGTVLVGRLEVAATGALTLGDGSPLIVEPSTALVINGPLTIPVGTTLRLLAGTTVTCGPTGSVTLAGTCTRVDVPCEALCP